MSQSFAKPRPAWAEGCGPKLKPKRWISKVGWFEIKGIECTITLEPRPNYCDRGNWLAKLHATGQLLTEIDGSDLWPRYYFDLDRAKLEIEAWLTKRGQMPAEAVE